MPAAPAPNRLRGCFVGAGAGALTIAAHGLGGGEYPDSTAIAVVLMVAAAVGVCAASVRAARPASAVLALLGAGQIAGHVGLAALSGHEHTPAAIGALPMIGAHCAATVLCVALILAAERLQTFVAAVVRLVAVRLARAVYAWRIKIFVVVSLLTGGAAPSPISRRGPPLAAA